MHGPDMRPEYPSIVYTQILKKLYPDVPVILGGIEASMRRLTHYDYWQDRVRPSILVDSGADALTYGMGEKPIVELVKRLNQQQSIFDIPQLAYLTKEVLPQEGDIILFPHEECLKDKKKQAADCRTLKDTLATWEVLLPICIRCEGMTKTYARSVSVLHVFTLKYALI